MAPQWASHVIWYALYPLGFTGAPKQGTTEVTHRLPQITAWLDHLIELGCNGLLLGPIFESTTHGYDTTNYFRIDPRLGDEADFDALIAACRERGIRVMLDGVFNHVGEEHLAVTTGIEDPDSDEADWFFFDRSHDPVTWLNFEGSNNLVRLNHQNPQVVELVHDVMEYWLDKGIDGWRLDAAYAVDPALWAAVLPRLRERFPDSVYVAEVIHADIDRVKASTVDSITGYEVWKATWSSIKDRNLFELDWSLKRHNELADLVVPLTFLSNHDVTRITTQVGTQGAVVALALLMCVPGMPAIYYGDEGGIEGTKYERADGDDEIRPQLPADPREWQPTVPWMMRHYQELIGLRRRYPWLVNARVTTEHLENERMTFTTSDGHHTLRVHVQIGDTCQVQIMDGSTEVFHFDDRLR